MTPALPMAAALIAWLTVAPLPAPAGAQAGEVFSSSDLDLAEGGALYRNRCMRCHGPDGDALAGADAADRSTVMPEDDLLRTIIDGIPDGGMPPSRLTAFEARTVAAYLRFVAADRIGDSEGDAGSGQALVEGRGGCLECHMINGAGSLIAPDLTGIGAVRTSGEIRDSLLDPDAEIRTENRYVDAHLSDGSTVRGRLLNQDSFSIQLLTTEERLRAISKNDLDELEFVGSPMPSFRTRLTSRELNDIVRYLTTLE